MKHAEDATQRMTTLSQCINKSIERGYIENFKIRSKDLVTENEKSSYTPHDIAIPDFYRFEGYSNPDDNSILYLIETNDGRKGTLIDAYGAYADAKLSNFIRQVENIQKKSNNKGRKSLFNFLMRSLQF